LGAALTLQCWVYDSFGNRTYELVNPSSCPSPGTTPSSWTPRLAYASSPNRVTGIDGNTIQYDAAGNVTQDLNNKYVYDQEGRLCAVQNILAGTATQYVYDAEGTRVAKGSIASWPAAGNPCAAPTAANGFSASYAWLKSANGGQDTQIQLGLSNPNYSNTNVYLNGSLLATYSFSTGYLDNNGALETVLGLNLSFAFNDWLGTKRLQINSAGQAVNTWASDPFGNYLTPGAGGSSDATDHHYTGKERDAESGLDYFGARYNSSAMGRFMSPDPLGGTLTDPQSLNKYSYVVNNPLRYTDPTGMYVCKDSAKCDSDADKAFEKSRQADLKSKDKDVVRGASAYGDPTKDNGVTVKFGDPGKGNDAITSHDLGVGPDGKLRANETVTVRDGLSGSGLDAAVGHEGSHVADAQDFVSTMTMGGNFDPSKNLSQYQTEFRVYMVTNSIMNSDGQQASYGQCGGGPCILGQGVSGRSAGNTINQLLANPANGYGVTPQSPGKLLYPILTTPQKPQ